MCVSAVSEYNKQVKDPSPEILAAGIKAEWAKADKDRANTAKLARRIFLWPESAAENPVETGGKKGGKKGEKEEKPRVRPLIPGSPPQRIRGGVSQEACELVDEEARQIELERLDKSMYISRCTRVHIVLE